MVWTCNFFNSLSPCYFICWANLRPVVSGYILGVMFLGLLVFGYFWVLNFTDDLGLDIYLGF